MSKIITIESESKRPRIVCYHCKKEYIIDIQGFNKDMTQIAEIVCPNCRKKMYMGILLLANSTPQGLFANINNLVKAANATNSLSMGKKGSNTGVLN